MFWMRDEAEGWVKQGQGGMVEEGGGGCVRAISQDKLWDPGWNREKTPADMLSFSRRGVFWCPDVSVNGFDSAVSQRRCCCCCKDPERWNSINIFIQRRAGACFSPWWTSFSSKAVVLQGVWSYLSTERYETLQWKAEPQWLVEWRNYFDAPHAEKRIFCISYYTNDQCKRLQGINSAEWTYLNDAHIFLFHFPPDSVDFLSEEAVRGCKNWLFHTWT